MVIKYWQKAGICSFCGEIKVTRLSDPFGRCKHCKRVGNFRELALEEVFILNLTEGDYEFLRQAQISTE